MKPKKTEKTEKTEPKRMGRPPKPSRRNVLAVRGSEEWREWLAEFAADRRTTPTGLIDLALAELAKGQKFKGPPDRV